MHFMYLFEILSTSQKYANNFKAYFDFNGMMQNLTKKTKINIDVKICDGILSKSIGLMFSSKQDKALIFEFDEEKIIPLHMLFVFYPIDVLFLDKEKTVVDKKENFMPFTFYNPKKKATYVAEIPQGSIKKLTAEVGDIIKF